MIIFLHSNIPKIWWRTPFLRDILNLVHPLTSLSIRLISRKMWARIRRFSQYRIHSWQDCWVQCHRIRVLLCLCSTSSTQLDKDVYIYGAFGYLSYLLYVNSSFYFLRVWFNLFVSLHVVLYIDIWPWQYPPDNPQHNTTFGRFPKICHVNFTYHIVWCSTNLLQLLLMVRVI